ncbi:MAG: 4-hydroxythreonine-4-phosphate dehydrogenase PdxA [Ignavibacteria bacterium]|nr:4-hydroxythreonine-4-phosphate dehydrogenase PdxA [Ignavibacteria bacterium]
MIKLVFTCGDINGIGPEICIKTFNQIYNPKNRIIIYLAPKDVFLKSIKIIKPKFKYRILDTKSVFQLSDSKVNIISLGNCKQKIGSPTKESGIISFTSIIESVKLIKTKIADALITAPISKSSFKMAKLNYPGHTELLSELSNEKKYLMTFLSEKMICALATIHEPINKVSAIITKKRILDSIKILHTMLQRDLQISNPRIAVLGLNPHAGEDGNLGKEETENIKPIINSLKGLNVYGPFVPDAFFGNHSYKNYNAVVGMYHDQVLIPFKMMNFNVGVNYTAGLPIIRTSPDHGTAYDIAGSGKADPSSMIEAVNWAEKIVRNRR